MRTNLQCIVCQVKLTPETAMSIRIQGSPERNKANKMSPGEHGDDAVCSWTCMRTQFDRLSATIRTEKLRAAEGDCPACKATQFYEVEKTVNLEEVQAECERCKGPITNFRWSKP